MTDTPTFPPNLPVLTDVVGEKTHSYPVLTEVVEKTTDELTALIKENASIEPMLVMADVPAPVEISAWRNAPEPFTESSAVTIESTPPAPSSDAPYLLQHVESYVEHVLAQKLAQHLAEAQQIAVERAIAELKHELPQLILDALKTPHDPS
ncbi:MAG: hypothetical protein HOO97_06105 [Sideroxydans sp.]|nr:hypothetical protein [Sideroxydans sp.]